MPSTSPPLGSDAPGGPLADERALEREFRARFDALAAEAKPHLKDAQGAAHRVVEALFLRAWDQRADLKTAQALDAFLHGELPHAAARELARRASAHHFGASGAQAGAHADQPVDVNGSWERLQHSLNPDRAKAAGTIHNVSRHDAAAHVKNLSKKRSWAIPVIIALIAIVLALVISRYLTHLGHEGKIVTALKAGDTKATQTQDAQIANVTLGDGSTVKLAPDSKLVIADEFGDQMRVIRLSGGGAINVVPGRPQPLEVRAYGAVIHAPSGMLYLRTYDDDSSLVVTARGATDSVRVGTSTSALADGAGLFVAHDGTVRAATPGELAEATTWASDTLTVNDRTMKQVLEQIRNWYGSSIVIPDKALEDRKVSFRAPLGSSVVVIAAVEKAGKVKFGYDGQAMVFRDAKR